MLVSQECSGEWFVSTGDTYLYEELWRACAGPLLEFPLTGERVYYFPQGHLEQLERSTSDEVNQPGYDLPSKILCRVLNIQLRAEENTDDVFAQITLLAEEDQNEPRNFETRPLEPPRDNFYSFCKVLTASDMSSRYGLSVPRKHATKCFPPLELSQETPAQELVAMDLHGNGWKFKHTFRGQPPRHLLTTGWSLFVSSKRLIAGDTVIFLRGEEGELRIGVKRLAWPQSSIPSTGISDRNVHQEIHAVVCHAFRVGALFSVNCKPRLSQFVVPLNKYLEAATQTFCIGMRIKMPFEVGDSLEKRSTGTIVEIGDTCQKTWPNSVWRRMKIRWDGRASITRPENISPWEIEPFENFVAQMPQKVLKRVKRKNHNDSNEQVVEIVDTVVSPSPRPKEASLKDIERVDGRCPTIIGGFLELAHEEETGEQNVAPANQIVESTVRGRDESERSLTNLLDYADVFQDETQLQPQGTFSNQAPISDINYRDQLEYTPDFSFPDNSLASEGSDAWIVNLLQGIDPDQHEAEKEISTHQQPLLENTHHIRHISSTYLIPYYGPDRGNELVNWASYSIPRRCIPILDRIITRYPELLSSFRLTSNVFQSMSLQILAEVVYMLEHLTIGSINQEQLDDSKRYLNDLKMSGIQVDWIERRLLQIDAVFKKATLVQRHEKLIQEVESVDRELEEVSSIIGNNPLNANQSVMQDLL